MKAASQICIQKVKISTVTSVTGVCHEVQSRLQQAIRSELSLVVVMLCTLPRGNDGGHPGWHNRKTFTSPLKAYHITRRRSQSSSIHWLKNWKSFSILFHFVSELTHQCTSCVLKMAVLVLSPLPIATSAATSVRFSLKLLTSIPCIFLLVSINLLTHAYILFIAHLPVQIRW